MAGKNDLIVVNFKNYKFGKGVLKLARSIEKIDKNIIVGVSACDIRLLKGKVKLPIYCQHVDYFNIGRNTGFILPESVASAGAVGVFLNHSEHKLGFEILAKTIGRCKESGLKTLVFASDLIEAKKADELNPDFIVLELPELIAGDISVSNAKPELISRVAKNLNCKFLVGAGIKTHDDFKKSIELGASGIAISSVITTADNPYESLKKLLGR